MRTLVGSLLLGTTLLMACGGGAATAPSPTPATTVSGTWAGSASDSTTATATGGMMGQSGMGNMTWQLIQNGNAVTGSMTFSGMPNGMAGRFTGTMDADDMTFTMDMPMGTMMSGGCAATARGTAHLDRTTMTMTGTYSGSNSCSGAFAGGQMNMSRR
jgi:hypothetical protein